MLTIYFCFTYYLQKEPDGAHIMFRDPNTGDIVTRIPHGSKIKEETCRSIINALNDHCDNNYFY